MSVLWSEGLVPFDIVLSVAIVRSGHVAVKTFPCLVKEKTICEDVNSVWTYVCSSVTHLASKPSKCKSSTCKRPDENHQ